MKRQKKNNTAELQPCFYKPAREIRHWLLNSTCCVSSLIIGSFSFSHLSRNRDATQTAMARIVVPSLRRKGSRGESSKAVLSLFFFAFNHIYLRPNFVPKIQSAVGAGVKRHFIFHVFFFFLSTSLTCQPERELWINRLKITCSHSSAFHSGAKVGKLINFVMNQFVHVVKPESSLSEKERGEKQAVKHK